MILVIDNYDSFTYNLVQYMGELGSEISVYRNDALSAKAAFDLKPQAIVISPGPKRPEHAGISMELISRVSGQIPVLGICLGCQSIAQAFGGKIVHAKKLMHGKASDIIHKGEGILHGLPNPFKAGRYHSLVIEPSLVPECLKVIASSEENEIMGIMHKNHANCYGLQFHPESILTPHGKTILKNFLDCLR